MESPAEAMPPEPVSETPRVPGDLAQYVPDTAKRVLDCSDNDPARGDALRARGAEVVDVVSVSGAIPDIDALLQHEVAQPYDAIVCDHVVQRRRNPTPLLEKLHALLKPGGVLLVATPNLQYHKAVRALAEGWWVYGEAGVWQRGNLRFFTATTLRDLCVDHGFKVLRCVPLRSDPESALPLDAKRFAHQGRVSIGPLAPAEYASYLAAEILCLAVREA